MEVLFSRKIKCSNCGRNFKGKMERNRRVYICSGYDNYGECKREPLSEDFIVELLQRRYGDSIEYTKRSIQNVVDKIEVSDRMTFTIHLKDDEPVIFGENFIQY